MVSIGIDLGTTNSLVSIFEESGPRLIVNSLGDYATILDFEGAGPDAQDGDKIEQALVRQPQLYPYYRDRAHWGPIIQGVLKAQFAQTGFPE